MMNSEDEGKQIWRLIESGKESQNLEKLSTILEKMGKQAVKLKNDMGVPMLNHAIIMHKADTAQLLLNYGADPFYTDDHGQTALHAAAQVDNKNILLSMLKLFPNCDVNIQDYSGNTPLHIAVRNVSADCTGWLVFVGANPDIPNKAGQIPMVLTTLNMFRQILRGYVKKHRSPTFATLENNQYYSADDLMFSIKLFSEGSELTTQSAQFTYFKTEDKSKLRNALSENEELVGPITEYRLLEPLTVVMTFRFSEPPEEQYEYVLYLAAELREEREIVLKLIDISKKTLQQPDATDFEATQKVDLDVSGTIALINRLTQQKVILGQGHSVVQSTVDERVELQLAKNFHGTIRGKLELERSVPVIESPALVARENSESELTCQSDYVRFIPENLTHSQPVEDGIIVVKFPVPPDFAGGNMHVYIRTSTPDSATESDTEDIEKETRRWIKKEEIKPSAKDSVKVPMTVNKTMTVVEPKGSVPEERMKKKIAKQYRKRKYKAVVFFVIARPWKAWLMCREAMIVVTTPTELPSQIRMRLVDGFTMIQLSGEVKVPKFSSFLISLTGNLLLESGDIQEIIHFRFAKSKSSDDNHCKFVVRSREGAPIKGGIVIKRKKAKKSKGLDQWKTLGQLSFDLSHPDEEDKTKPFTDAILMKLAKDLPASQMAQFGIHMGLKQVDVINVLTDPSCFSPVFKSFQILKLQRDKCSSILEFADSVTKALTLMELNLQREWLLEQLQELKWDGLDELRARIVAGQ